MHCKKQAVKNHQSGQGPQSGWQYNLDKILLHPWLGIPFFFGLIYLLFLLTLSGGAKVQGVFEEFLKTIFVQNLAESFIHSVLPEWICALIMGIGKGLHITLSFVPVLGSLFLTLCFLETSGFLSRASYVMHRLMQIIGLSGRSFVPMIIGFGCNVPAILSTKSLKDPRERLLTILMSPFMSCGARLAIYALFVSAFFPGGGANIIFGLYLVGILMAVFTGWCLRKLLNLDAYPEEHCEITLPAYQWPGYKLLLKSTGSRLTGFLIKIGIIIVGLTTLLSLLGLSLDELSVFSEKSHLNHLAQTLTPIFAPMGIQAENWVAVLGLFSGLLAKEVVVGTLTSLYAEQGEVLGVMLKQFGSQASAVAYLLFILLYFPCVSVLATIAKELNRFWAAFSAVWTTVLAYGMAVIFYQLATFSLHPVYAIEWILGILGSFSLGLGCLKWYFRGKLKLGGVGGVGSVRTVMDLNRSLGLDLAGSKLRGVASKLKPLPTQIHIKN